jgi:hypothetical protein
MEMQGQMQDTFSEVRFKSKKSESCSKFMQTKFETCHVPFLQLKLSIPKTLLAWISLIESNICNPGSLENLHQKFRECRTATFEMMCDEIPKNPSSLGVRFMCWIIG